MRKFLLQMILAILFEGVWLPSTEEDFTCATALFQEEEQMQRAGWPSQEESPEGESWPGSWSRSMFSAYIVGGVDCMGDGSYDQYVEGLGTYTDSHDSGYSDFQEDAFPQISFGFMGLDVTDYQADQGDDSQYDFYKAFCSDRFYMEYPCDWYVGATDACSLTFVPEWEEEASRQMLGDWREYFDENLEGKIGDVRTYIEGGGINDCLEETLGKPLTETYQLVLRKEDSDWLLIYDLKEGDREAAEIVVWCNLGKCSVRSWDVDLRVNPLEDYGRIMVFQEWDVFDFSSKEAIKEYVESGSFLYRLLGTALEEEVEERIIQFTTSSFSTIYHDFVTVQVKIWDADQTEHLLRQATVYIPVPQPEQDNWVVVFESFPGSRKEDGVANSQVQKQVMSTFVALPFYHEVTAGETLSAIAELYGESCGLAYDIAKYWPNHISRPDWIYPKQRIEIPLGVLFQRRHHFWEDNL